MEAAVVLKNKLIMNSYQKLQSLKYSNGLRCASPTKETGYNRIWLRDNIYQALGLEKINMKEAVKTYRAILKILKKYEWKIDKAIISKPKTKQDYIHPIYTPEMSEINQEWGFKQNDAIGALLFKIGDLELKGKRILRSKKDRQIMQKLVYYLASIEYWKDTDNGIWEEHEELHASSIGACVAGLKKISKIVYVPKYLIKNGELSLKKILPRESETKEVDMALLSLIYPYNVVSKKMAATILKNVESNLVRNKGVIRYIGDKYYFRGKEAEWTMGFPWLAIIYRNFNNPEKYAHYMRKTIEVMNANSELPELYFGDSNEHNENTPLGWSQALFIVALS
ncbi:MAG: glycoside hydrolase family 15 protein [Candidatus Woesearchaeota archaeon]